MVTSQAVYTTSDALVVTARVTFGGAPVAGVSVNIKANPRGGGTPINGSATTSSTGAAVFNYRFNRKRDKRGLFDLIASGKINGVVVSGTTVFELR